MSLKGGGEGAGQPADTGDVPDVPPEGSARKAVREAGGRWQAAPGGRGRRSGGDRGGRGGLVTKADRHMEAITPGDGVGCS